MSLIENWQSVLTKAWSVRLIIVAGLLSGAEIAVQLGGNWLELPPGLFSTLAGLVSAAALVARLMAQQNVGTASGSVGGATNGDA